MRSEHFLNHISLRYDTFLQVSEDQQSCWQMARSLTLTFYQRAPLSVIRWPCQQKAWCRPSQEAWVASVERKTHGKSIDLEQSLLQHFLRISSLRVLSPLSSIGSRWQMAIQPLRRLLVQFQVDLLGLHHKCQLSCFHLKANVWKSGLRSWLDGLNKPSNGNR